VAEKAPDRVSIKISATLHREVDIESAHTRTPIYKLLEESWEAYKREKAGAAPKLAEQRPSQSNGLTVATTPDELLYVEALLAVLRAPEVDPEDRGLAMRTLSLVARQAGIKLEAKRPERRKRVG
jgi:hypothetical protein